METTKEMLEARVRETPLLDRLKGCRQRIGKMCSEGRPPRMCIPVQHDDDDFFISTTLTDAQATIEALQRERDQWKEAFERSCDDTAHLKAALDDEREKVTKLEVALDAAQDESTRWFRAARLQREAGRDLRALVRGLPNIEGEIMVSESLVLAEEPDMCSDMSDKREAEAYAALLRYRATLDATPTEEAT